VSSWVNPASLLTGVLFVATSAYLAAVFLAVDSERAGDPGLRGYFTRRALGAGVVTGLLAAATLAVLHTTAAGEFSALTTGRALPLLVISVLAGAAVLALLVVDRTRLIRPLAVLAVTAVVWGWAVAQYPDLLPPRLTIQAAAAPAGAQAAELVVVGIIVLLVVPSFVWLFSLAQRGTLSESGETSASILAPGDGPRTGS